MPTLYLERHVVPYEDVAGDARTGARPGPHELLPAVGDLGRLATHCDLASCLDAQYAILGPDPELYPEYSLYFWDDRIFDQTL